MLAHVLVLEMGSHRDLPLKAAIADRTVVGQRFGVRGKVFGQMVLAEEPLLAHTALVRLHASVAHFVAPHVGAIGELHVAHIALKQFAMVLVGRLMCRVRLVRTGRRRRAGRLRIAFGSILIGRGGRIRVPPLDRNRSARSSAARALGNVHNEQSS